MLCLAGTGQTALSPGDIGITSYQSDTPDAFSFVLLVDVAPNTEINFTDNGWQSSGSFRPNEGVIAYNSGATLVPAGTLVVVVSGMVTIGPGSMTGSMLALNTSGDQLFAFQGTTLSPTLLAGLQMNGNWDTDASSSATSAEPAAIAAGTGAMSLAIFPKKQNAVFNIALTGTQAEQIALLNDSGNWLSGNGLLVVTPPALPVELTSFTAAVQDAEIVLHWQTAKEINNDYFRVERSTDGIGFAPIAEVTGSGTTNGPTDYRYVDAAPLAGTNYYRLVQVDYDGTSDISPVRSATLEGGGNATVFPNPAGESVTITLTDEVQEADLQVHDLNGRLVLRQNFSGWQAELGLGALPGGTYVLRITNGAQRSVQRLVKL